VYWLAHEVNYTVYLVYFNIYLQYAQQNKRAKMEISLTKEEVDTHGKLPLPEDKNQFYSPTISIVLLVRNTRMSGYGAGGWGLIPGRVLAKIVKLVVVASLFSAHGSMVSITTGPPVSRYS